MNVNYQQLLSQRGLSSDDKLFIEKAYHSTFGRDMLLKNSKCRNCYNDALIEMIAFERKGYIIRAGVVINYEGKTYNRHSEILPIGLIELYKDKLYKL